MTDEELLAKERQARKRAWEAPKSDSGSPNDLWARASREWTKLHDEVLSRGLKPSTADPNFRRTSK